MLKVIAWVAKNMALLVGIIESVIKFLAGIASLTPTKKDDKIVSIVDTIFSSVKKFLYDISDKVAA